jgi:subtilisin family serine protease
LTIARGLKSSPGTLEVVREISTAARARLLEDERGASSFDDGNTRYVVLNLEFKDAASCQEFSVPGTKLITRFDRFADVFAKADQATLGQIEKFPGLLWYDIDSTDILPPPARPVPKKETPRAVPDKIVRGGMAGLTGKGVIVAVIDSGVDFRHPDFITYDADGKPTSRLLYFWDTGSDAYANGVGDPAPIAYPNGAPIGTIYSRDVLTTDLRTGLTKIPVWDPNGHGTACAGIAAGNGKVNKNYTGVAPNATIIGVRAASGSNSAMDNAYLVNAICEWLDKVAGQQPLVVSCSWGGQYGGHDGHLVTERHLSARFAPEKKSRAILFAAGNEGFDPIHAPIAIGTKDKPGEIRWMNDSKGSLEIYLPVSSDSGLHLSPTGDWEISKVNSYVHGLSNHLVIEMRIPTGRGGVSLYSDSETKLVGDAYIYGPKASFTNESYELGKQVGSPGSATNVLTIGSYDWNDQFSTRGQTLLVPDFQRNQPLSIGGLSTYSSPGPLRFGNVWKPEIVAPGQWYSAPAPMNVVTDRDSSGLYQLFNGTSAATPYAAGIVTLLFEAKPAATFGEIRQVLIESATQDAVTRQCPNPKWGYGKLDYAAVEKAVARMKK